MGSLIKDQSYSEITATLERLDRFGITPEHFKEIRSDDATAKLVVEAWDAAMKNRFANEEVATKLGYPVEYRGPRPIKEQIAALAKIFNLDSSKALAFAENLPKCPEGAEGWFAIPSVDALAKKHFPEVTDSVQKYCHVVQLVQAKIAASRRSHNYREGQITPNRLRVHARTAHAMDLIADQQPGDILVVAAQFGMKHRGRSVRRARVLFAPNEFGLGALAGCCMALTHPERFVCWEQLHVDFAGDEFAPDADGDFDEAPNLFFHDVQLKFDTVWTDDTYEYYGSASGFVSQQL